MTRRSKHVGQHGAYRISMTMRVVKTYYWIQQFIKEHDGRAPTYIEIGEWIGGSDNRVTTRNRGIQVCKPLLRQGFIVREGYGRGSKIKITDKPFTEAYIVTPYVPKPH